MFSGDIMFKAQKSLFTLLMSASLSTLLLSGCGDSEKSKENELEFSSFSLAISDAPVDDLSEVVICFSHIVLKGNGEDKTFNVGVDSGAISANEQCLDDTGNVIPNTVGLNLLEFTGTQSIQLVENMQIEAGEYSQLRIQMSEGSYGVHADTLEKILVSVPSNELKLDGFTATIGNVVDFTLEFDLRKGMTNPVGQSGYFLKPRGVRLVNNNDAGHLKGSVSETFLSNNQCSPLADPDNSPAALYLFPGSNLALENLADNGGGESNESLASASVIYNAENLIYEYEIGFINSGDYSVAITCNVLDDPDLDDDIIFIESKNVTVVSGNAATEINFGN